MLSLLSLVVILVIFHLGRRKSPLWLQFLRKGANYASTCTVPAPLAQLPEENVGVFDPYRIESPPHGPRGQLPLSPKYPPSHIRSLGELPRATSTTHASRQAQVTATATIILTSSPLTSPVRRTALFPSPPPIVRVGPPRSPYCVTSPLLFDFP